MLKNRFGLPTGGYRLSQLFFNFYLLTMGSFIAIVIVADFLIATALRDISDDYTRRFMQGTVAMIEDDLFRHRRSDWAKRIKTIGGRVPGSLDNKCDQTYLQPPKDTTNIVAVIKGVIKAEEGAIKQYNKIIKLADGRDYVTQDMAITLLSGEEKHRREFIGFLKEYEKA